MPRDEIDEISTTAGILQAIALLVKTATPFESEYDNLNTYNEIPEDEGWREKEDSEGFPPQKPASLVQRVEPATKFTEGNYGSNEVDTKRLPSLESSTYALQKNSGMVPRVQPDTNYTEGNYDFDEIILDPDGYEYFKGVSRAY
jgi:hypothetical protein